MRVLVTGVGGFVGGNVALRLAQREGLQVVGLYRGNLSPLASMAHSGGVSLVRCDLNDIREDFGPFDAVVHCAAASSPQHSDEAIERDNICGMWRLVSAAALKWPCKAFVFCSSLSLYGTIEQEEVTEQTPMIDPCRYGQSKKTGEDQLKASGLNAIALRLPGVLGPGGHRRAWFSGVAGKLIVGAPIRAFNLCQPWNNAAHVDDIAAFAAHIILNRPWFHNGCETAVVGARGTTSVQTAILRLARRLGVEAKIEEIDAPKTAFTLCSDRAISLGYDPMDIGEMIDRFAVDVRGDLGMLAA